MIKDNEIRADHKEARGSVMSHANRIFTAKDFLRLNSALIFAAYY